MTYTKSFPIHFQGAASADAVVTVPGARFTLLSPRLLRLEYSPTDQFEDRPSQAFWCRRLTAPRFDVRRENESIEIETDHLLLHYQMNDAGFSASTLSVTLLESAATWRFGQDDHLNLLGTARTLDNVDGALVLEQGLLSRQGWAVYDDSESLVFDDQGWLEPRDAPEGNLDLYFFGFGRDFQACLHEFRAIAGAAPMVPRWALGNWWSRYWAYTDEELLRLMDEFRAHDVPLSVCIVDMDWHITKTGNASSGWTGYTWNRDLLPDPPGFISELHRRGLKTALNLHPADGIYPHEEQYPAMAERLGLDPQSETPIPFDIADPEFTSAYFELLHHPYEADGIDFWWIDWQQGTASAMAGLDPLWWLNHLHFYDLGRTGQKRPFIFSRWGGLGNHRYPIGFSGDALVTWESLAFQPYFTATAANVNYGWWSHDIGGHMGGVEEPELFTRWVQFGVFSPIFRLHSTNNPFHERRPWGYDRETEAVISEAMRLRHDLVPYLYTMAWRNHTEHMPLVRPMYHAYPAEEPAYHCPDQYYFGSELVVAPFTGPAGEDTRLSRQVVWLPEGDWFDFFHRDGADHPGFKSNADRYAGGGWYALYGGLQDIPVFARAGAIVPLADRDEWSDTDNPASFAIHVFPGADNEFLLYEDDGLLTSCRTPIRATWSEENWQITVAPCQGASTQVDVNTFLPAERSFNLCFREIVEKTVVTAALDGDPVEVTTVYEAHTGTLKVFVPAKKASQALTVNVAAAGGSLLLPGEYRLAACRRLVRAFKMDTWVKMRLDRELPAILREPDLLANYELSLAAEQIRALAEVVTGSGYHRSSVRRAKEEAILLWNNDESDAVFFRLVAEDLNYRPEIVKGRLPRFAVLHVGEELLRLQSGSQPAGGQITIDDWFDSLADRIEAEHAEGVKAVVQFDITGPQGRSAFLELAEEQEAALTDGQFEEPDATITANDGDWLAIINGLMTPEAAFLGGKLGVAGNVDLVLQLADIIRFSPPSTYLAEGWRLDLNYMDLLTVPLGNR